MKKVTLIAIFTSIALMLQGCPTVALFSVFGAGVTSVATDSRTTGAQIDDTTLYTRVNNTMRSYKKQFASARIVLTSYNGNILLTGQANSTQILKAEQVVQQVPGVNRVINQLTNGEPISAHVIANDSWITAKVKSQLVATEGPDALKIKIVTEDSNVFLLGAVSRELGRSVADITSKVYGVSHVTTVYNYTD